MRKMKSSYFNSVNCEMEYDREYNAILCYPKSRVKM